MIDHDTKSVTGCNDCPMLHKAAYDIGDFCGAAENASGSLRSVDDHTGDDDPPPDWCPLRARSILVRLVPRTT